jgi:Flp pilus assembly protein TadD
VKTPSRAKLSGAAALAVGLGLTGLAVHSLLTDRANAKRRADLASAASWNLDHGQPQQALVALEALGAVEPEAKGLRTSMGRALTSVGRASEAVKVLDQALSAAPDDVEALEYQGVARAMLGNAKGAQAALERALTLEPKRTSARRRLAQVLLTQGKVADASQAWQDAAMTAPSQRADIATEARTLLRAAGHSNEAQRVDGWP